jgi:hypothetical protein
MLHKPARLESARIRRAAEGQSCTMQSPYCNGSADTVVFCHSNLPEHTGGMGMKASDVHGWFGCVGCHDWFDGRKDNKLPPESVRREWFGYANARTLQILVRDGIVQAR